MANGAVHLVLDGGTGALQSRTDLRMALCAGRTAVGRGGVTSFIDEKRDLAAVPLHGKVRVGMTAEALRVGHPLRTEWSPTNPVGLMAIDARGNLFGFFFPEPPLNHLNVDLLDPAVATHAGLSYVVRVDA